MAPFVTTSTGPAPRALVLHVRGLVQGVGFRPFVHRLALRHGLAGRVRNESGSVRIEVEGEPESLDTFLARLREEAPPLARIDGIEVEATVPLRLRDFAVIASETEPRGRLPVSPDVALCAACRAELLDPANRRHRYPFITCTDCGPRFTVIEAMPYDRERTSMRAFDQCPACLEEYRTPADRRYHSETNSCSDCGPRLWFEEVGQSGGRVAGAAAAIAAAARALRQGAIVAVRGLGGFQLAVDATSEPAVRRLRTRKAREAKPLAVMVASLEAAAGLGVAGTRERALLASPEAPIVLLCARPDNGLAAAVAPGLDTVGVFVASTPLHLLLLDAVGRPLVMTSGNRSEEPIATGNGEARARLAGIADAYLLHDREIVARYDDSVVRVAGDDRIMLRRARGYAPLPLALPVPARTPLFAVGPHLKNTFALGEGGRAYVSQHIGDLENLETLEHFEESVARFRALFRIEPRIAVRDLHPGYLSTRIAEEAGLERVIPVQHHHAHVAAVAAEHGITGPVVGLAFDGTGYGDDGRVWGAETLVADLRSYRRAGRLRWAPLPGGDLAAHEPWRVALGYLSLDPAVAASFAAAFAGIPDDVQAVAGTQIRRGLNAPLASSMGRLFDAAAAVLGVRTHSAHEGHAAMELEALAGSIPAEPLPFPFAHEADGCRVLDPLPLLFALGEARARGADPSGLAAAFHESVAAAATALAAEVCEETGIARVALGGGVFQNARLLVSVRRRLEARGLTVLVPLELGPNDGSISYGQAAVAAALLDSEEGD